MLSLAKFCIQSAHIVALEGEVAVSLQKSGKQRVSIILPDSPSWQQWAAAIQSNPIFIVKYSWQNATESITIRNLACEQFGSGNCHRYSRVIFWYFGLIWDCYPLVIMLLQMCVKIPAVISCVYLAGIVSLPVCVLITRRFLTYLLRTRKPVIISMWLVCIYLIQSVIIVINCVMYYV